MIPRITIPATSIMVHGLPSLTPPLPAVLLEGVFFTASVDVERLVVVITAGGGVVGRSVIDVTVPARVNATFVNKTDPPSIVVPVARALSSSFCRRSIRPWGTDEGVAE